jgi:hypothetical protein
MTLLTDAQIRQIRAETGSSPSDDALQDLWDVFGDVTKVALAVLRPRMADALTAAASGGLTIPGVLSVTAPASPQALREQISRLEAELTPADADQGFRAVSSIAGRPDRPR